MGVVSWDSIARCRFHSTMVELIASVCDHIGGSTQLGAVVQSGEVFMNAWLSIEAIGGSSVMASRLQSQARAAEKMED